MIIVYALTLEEVYQDMGKVLAYLVAQANTATTDYIREVALKRIQEFAWAFASQGTLAQRAKFVSEWIEALS